METHYLSTGGEEPKTSMYIRCHDTVDDYQVTFDLVQQSDLYYPTHLPNGNEFDVCIQGTDLLLVEYVDGATSKKCAEALKTKHNVN